MTTLSFVIAVSTQLMLAELRRRSDCLKIEEERKVKEIELRVAIEGKRTLKIKADQCRGR